MWIQNVIGPQMLRFSMWSDKIFKNQYDEKALIGWNGSNVIDQSVKQVQTQPTPLIGSNVNSNVIWPQLLRLGGWEKMQKKNQKINMMKRHWLVEKSN
jgi:hypothetical protein